MFKELFEAIPKSFYISLPRPASKKHALSKDGSLIDIDAKEGAITIDGKPMIWVYDGGIDWDSSWSWSDFDSKVGKKIEKMIDYLKTSYK